MSRKAFQRRTLRWREASQRVPYSDTCGDSWVPIGHHSHVLRRQRKQTHAARANVLRLDFERDVSQRHCDSCGRDFVLVKGFVHRDDVPCAVYFVACHRHDGEREAWIDLILGTFGDDASDHVTFGARVGPVSGQIDPAATLVDAAIPYSDSAIFRPKSHAGRGACTFAASRMLGGRRLHPPERRGRSRTRLLAGACARWPIRNDSLGLAIVCSLECPRNVHVPVKTRRHAAGRSGRSTSETR